MIRKEGSIDSLVELVERVAVSLSNTLKGKFLTLKGAQDSRSLLGLSDSIWQPDGVGLLVFQVLSV